MTQNTDSEIIIDFNKALKTIIDNKKTIITCFLLAMSVGILLNFILPKKYTSEAKILIKKTGSTNLSYINPYVIPETIESTGYNRFFAVKNSLNEEIEIIKAPLVIDNTIKENNLKYNKGPAKGNYLSTEDFLRTNFNISKLKDADIIYISYKSKNPVLSYNIINSIINNYKSIQENINFEKASNDSVFLQKACLKAEKELNFKINQFKKYNNQTESLTVGSSTPNLSMLGFYDKRFKQKLKQISDNQTNFKKLEREITRKSEDLDILKKKLEWSLLVEEMSKNTTNIIILQSPKIKEKHAFSEPQPLIIFIFCVFGWILTCLTAVNFRKNKT